MATTPLSGKTCSSISSKAHTMSWPPSSDPPEACPTCRALRSFQLLFLWLASHFLSRTVTTFPKNSIPSWRLTKEPSQFQSHIYLAIYPLHYFALILVFMFYLFVLIINYKHYIWSKIYNLKCPSFNLPVSSPHLVLEGISTSADMVEQDSWAFIPFLKPAQSLFPWLIFWLLHSHYAPPSSPWLLSNPSPTKASVPSNCLPTVGVLSSSSSFSVICLLGEIISSFPFLGLLTLYLTVWGAHHECHFCPITALFKSPSRAPGEYVWIPWRVRHSFYHGLCTVPCIPSINARWCYC